MSYSEDLALLDNPTFDEFHRIAANNLSSSKKAHPWIGLNHGIKLLENDDELAQYLCAYGKMHKEKIDSALDAIKDPVEYFTKELTIIDWGCGQGLASICFLDYMRILGIDPKVEKIVLIEPSKPALSRAQDHLLKYCDDNMIIAVNKYINDVKKDDIPVTSGLVIHFLSNILDIASVDITHLANVIKENIPNEQLFFCVGPQNIGASRISEFAKLFDIEDEDLIREHTGKLTGRGTISLLVFKLKTKVKEIIKVEYHHHRNFNIENCTSLQRVLKESDRLINTENNDNISDKALLFYRSVIELERIKSSLLGSTFSYPIHFTDEQGTTKIKIDLQENTDFESQFKLNQLEKWPKNLNIGIGLLFGTRLYNILQFIYPYEDIKHVDIGNQYITIELSSFSLNIDAAEELEIGEEQQEVIESMICDSSTNWNSLESILKDAINSEVSLDNNLHLSLSTENPTLGQTSSELKQLLSRNYGEWLKEFLSGNITNNIVDVYDEDTLLQIKPIDESQRKAIASALCSKVSVITGPPGTGKTQVILNIIANAFLKGKSVLVASKNNKAVDNIKERYDDVDPTHYLLRFGSKDTINRQVLPYLDSVVGMISKLHTDTQKYYDLHEKYKSHCNVIHDGRSILRKLASLQEKYKAFLEKIREKEAEQDLLVTNYNAEVNSLSSKYQDVLELSQNDKDWYKELTRVKKEINTLQSKYSGIGKLFFDWFSKKKQSASSLNNLQQMPQQYIKMVEEKAQISCVADIKTGQDLISLYETEKAIIDRIISCSSDFTKCETAYNSEKSTCDRELNSLKDSEKTCKSQIDQITAAYDNIIRAIEQGRESIKDLSVELFKSAVSLRLNKDTTGAIISKYKNYLLSGIPSIAGKLGKTYLETAQEFLEVFRLNAVTNLSIKNSYTLENGFFDIVIIDEASQCDVASALPLIYRAKQLVVIGDPLQLKHISAVNSDEELAIKEHLNFAENPLARYADYSLWDYCNDLITTTKDNNRPIVLDCHYRCHPQIIGYSNRMFYERRLGTTLNVKTIEKNPLLRQKGIIWEDVRGSQKSERLNINEDEAKKCISIATQLANQNPEISIGIISPFKHQAEEINARIPAELRDRIVADTVHKFQGDERDVIIYSLVVTNNSPDRKIRWIDYSVPYLVNVAVTRARTALYIVGNKSYIKTHSKLDLPLGNLVDYCETLGFAPSIEPTKTYIIDTNVFIYCPDIIDYINPRDHIVLPAMVLEELDNKKVAPDEELKRKVRAALRYIHSKYSDRNIRTEFSDMNYLPADFRRKKPDNMILSVALKFRNQNPVLLTSDLDFQLKAKGLGITVLYYKDLIGKNENDY